jgi:hypothetical protein
MTGMAIPDSKVWELSNNSSSIVETIRACICDDQIRLAETWLLALENGPVRDHTDLDSGVRTISWRRPTFARWIAPRYLSDPDAAVALVVAVSGNFSKALDEDEIVRRALTAVSLGSGFGWFSNINRRIAHRIVLALLDNIKGD